MDSRDSRFWDERFGIDEYVYGCEPNDFLREHVQHIPPGRVLCLAEGEGRNATFLASLGYAVTAVDFSSRGLRKTERLARERGVTVSTVQADLADYEPEADAFTAVVSIFAHLPPAVRARVHGWVPRALRPGGVFLLEAYTPRQLTFGTGGPRDPALLMTLDGLEQELAPLTIVMGRELDRDVIEGRFHSGPSATVQLLAARRAE